MVGRGSRKIVKGRPKKGATWKNLVMLGQSARRAVGWRGEQLGALQAVVTLLDNRISVSLLLGFGRLGASPYQVCYLFSLSCRSSCRHMSGMVVMFFLITYHTAEATISDINFARQFSTKNRLTVDFMAITQTVSDRTSPLA